MRTIRVTGKGKIKVKPDQIRLIINLEHCEKDYDKALVHSAKSMDTLQKVLADVGFEKKDLKTVAFSIDVEYESYRDKNDDWKRRFKGYKYEHCLKLEFDLDNKKLGKVLYQLAHCKLTPEFRIIYTVKDPEESKNLLLANAVTDSKAKAEILAKAAGVQLQDIQTIDYSWGELEIYSEPMRKMMAPIAMQDEDDFGIDMEPDDIDLQDTVTVVWDIN